MSLFNIKLSYFYESMLIARKVVTTLLMLILPQCKLQVSIILWAVPFYLPQFQTAAKWQDAPWYSLLQWFIICCITKFSAWYCDMSDWFKEVLSLVCWQWVKCVHSHALSTLTIMLTIKMVLLCYKCFHSISKALCTNIIILLITFI